jgi:FSR family fosmidomycin resistance protein-like MFS transporter
MARWTFAGALGVLVGSITLGVTLALGWSWRIPFAMLAGIFFLVIVWGWRLDYPQSRTVDEDGEEVGLRDGFRLALKAMRRPEVVRWLILLEFCNLLLDILLSFLALYLVDVVQVSESQAAFGVTVWVGVGLVGDFALIFLLERVKGLTYLRWSVVAETVLYALFLLVPSFELKLVALATLGFFNAGWYSILKGQLYSVMHGQSGAVMAVGTVTGILGSLLPLVIGLLADAFGLDVAMWALMAGPLVIWIGLPRKASGFVEGAVEEE